MENACFWCDRTKTDSGEEVFIIDEGRPGCEPVYAHLSCHTVARQDTPEIDAAQVDSLLTTAPPTEEDYYAY